MKVEVAGFDAMSARTVHDVLRLRQDVFVVEQACAYPDVDGRDVEETTRHVVGREDDRVVAYARVLDDGGTWRVGRVVLDRSVRGRGLADVLLRAALDACPGRDVVLDAQTPLSAWYAGFGFTVVGEEFLEDGIPHVPMRLSRG